MADITSGLRGWWKLDEGIGTVAYDSSGLGNNGTLDVAVTWIPGIINSGIDTSAVTTAMTAASGFNFPTANVLSLACWFKIASLASRQNLISWRVGTDDGIGLEVGPGNVHTNVVAVTSTNTWNLETVNNSITTNIWTHVVFTKNGTGAGKQNLYINGVLTSLQTDNAISEPSANPVKLYGPLTGLDDVRGYNRVLTAGDVRELYSRHRRGFGNYVSVGDGMSRNEIASF